MIKSVYFVAILIMAQLLPILGCKSLAGFIYSKGVVFTVAIKANDGVSDELIDRALSITESKMRDLRLKGEVIRSTEARDQIQVKIYGEHDLERLRRILFQTYRLELKPLVSPPSPSPAQVFSNRDDAEAAAASDQQVLPYSERENDSEQFVIVKKDAIVTGEHIEYADAVSRTGNDDDNQISFRLSKAGAERMEHWTNRNINNYLAIVLNDQVISTAYIRSVISDAGEISGRFTKESAEELAMSLNSGYLPATMTVIQERLFE
ncbi:MAG TPA: hypothetical protein PKD24_03830 [Pyrinomonadaceae bacterium]|nr:hypothetical protein [Pyrinomonadaceae bacterium]HMP64681.1 hypothetical protein [Pyrinomonadaceae bacterium]